MKAKQLIVVTGLAGAGIALVLWQRQEIAALADRQSELTVAVRQAEHSAQVARDEHAVRVRLAAADPPIAPRAPDAPPAQHPMDADPPPPPVAPPVPATYMTHLDSSFADERGDTVWAGRASEAVTSRLAAVGDHSLRSLECRTSMCRLVADDAGRDEAWRQIHAILGNPGDEVWSGAYFSRVEQAGNGRPERVTYLFRSGTLLPRAVADQ